MRLKALLYPYQREAKEFALRSRYSICALEMGLGKSVTSLAAAIEARAKKVLVVCPAFLKQNWLEEIEKFTDGLDVDVCSYTLLSKLPESNWDFIIFDEAHYLKSIKAKRTKTAYAVVDSLKPDYLMLLTGTPVKNSVIDFWSLMNLCSWHKHHSFKFFMNYWQFCRYYCHEKKINVGNTTFTKFEGIKMDRVEHLKQELRPMYFRKRLKDVSLELPEIVRRHIKLKNKSKYDVELKQALKSLNKDSDTVFFSTLKAANALSKVKHTVELAEEVGKSGKVIIFSDHVDSAKAIAESLRCSFIIGSVNMRFRNSILKCFKNSNDKYLVASIGSLSAGVNLSEANHMIFNDFAWVATDMDQAEKRIHRIGQKKTCFYYYVFSSDMDEKIYKTVIRKKREAKAIQ